MATSKQSRSPADRRARVEEMRRQQKSKERRQTVIISVIGGVVAIAILAVIIVAAVHNKTGVTGQRNAQILPANVDNTAAVTVQPTPSTTPDSSGISGVRAWVTNTASPGALTHDHVDGPVTYAVTPPVGGPHNATWANCGVYVDPIPNERAVHDLEHGAIWITYRKSTPASVVSQLQKFVTSQKNAVLKGQSGGQDLQSHYMDLSPWTSDSLSSPIVLSAWGRQLGVDSPSDPRMQKFVDTFRADADLTYEAGAQCGGVPVNQGGQPVAQ